MSIHETISSIKPDDESTWQGKIFLTFDLDWAHDDVLNDTIDLVEAADVPATWFVTHASPVLSRLRENPKFELGIHPNFNWLLNGDSRNGANAQEVLQKILDIVPDAKCVRSHSMVQSSRLLDTFSSLGLTHDVNHFIPASIASDIRPWTLWNGVTRVPYIWEDDIYCLYEENFGELGAHEAVKDGLGIKVFDMHPIHVFLNTARLDHYEEARSLHQDPSTLINCRHDGFGTRNHLLDLLHVMTSTRYKKLGS